MSAHKIAVLGGDGIGPEVTTVALQVMRAAGADLETTEYDLGGRRYLSTGEVLPDSVLEELRGYDAILLGAVGTPEVPPGVLERGLLLKIRFELDLYINQRPFVWPAKNIDMIVPFRSASTPQRVITNTPTADAIFCSGMATF